MSWSRRFDGPIELPDGRKLKTLAEAIAYLAETVPKAERKHPTVVIAADHLTRAAEQPHDLRPHGGAAGDPSPSKAGHQSRSQRHTLEETQAEERPVTLAKGAKEYR